MSSQPASPLPEPHIPAPAWLWDVFCQVIDNFGDIGVCWRLCADLAQRGHSVRLWVDDSSALDWMAPGARQGQWPGISVRAWEEAADAAKLRDLPPADVWIEGFGCHIAPEFIAARAHSVSANALNDTKPPVWINLEYLSAEDYVERCHALPSPVMQGPAKGWTKHFYYPGFTAGTGGLLREPALEEWQHGLDDSWRGAWLADQGVAWTGERLISLFCYEPAALAQALADWMRSDAPTLLLVTPGRAARAVTEALPEAQSLAGLGLPNSPLRLHYLEAMSQPDFDALLHCCDLNFVRGEDSLVRALWAGQPFVWHIYPQDDGAHGEKLAAFLDCMGADATVRQVHAAWNGMPLNHDAPDQQPALDWSRLPLRDWRLQMQGWRDRLRQQPDLVSGLLSFVEKRR